MMIKSNIDMKHKYSNYNKMFDQIKQLGYPDINDFDNETSYINTIKPIPEDIINVVLKWVPKLENKSWVIHLLREAKKPYDGTVLIPMFQESSPFERWFISEAIASNPPLNIENWVKEIFLSKKYGYSEIGMLPLAIAKMFPREEAREILRKGFDYNYRVTPEALGKIGKMEDIPFLKEKLKKEYNATHVHKDIQKAIKRIEKREMKKIK